MVSIPLSTVRPFLGGSRMESRPIIPNCNRVLCPSETDLQVVVLGDKVVAVFHDEAAMKRGWWSVTSLRAVVSLLTHSHLG